MICPLTKKPTGSVPERPGEKAYTSNGQSSFTGNYYLAPVDLQRSDTDGGAVETSRIMVLVLSAGQIAPLPGNWLQPREFYF